MKNSTAPQRFGLIAFCMGILILIVLWAQSINGLAPIDDHHFIQTIFCGKDFGTYVMPEIGRFIPLTAQEYVLSVKFFAPSAHLFHIISAIKMFICGLLLLHCLILTKATNWTVAILWGCVILSIGFANASLRLQIGELNVLIAILLFVWSAIILETTTQRSRAKQNIIAFGGFAVFAFSLLYKELIFVFMLVFGIAELLRHFRQVRACMPRRTWSLTILGACYIAGYVYWRSIHNTGKSYAGFFSTSTWDIIIQFANNDPFIIFIAIPLTIYRAVLFLRNASQHTIYDSFLLSASAYAGAYVALGMFNTYYLLPAYGFAACGVAGIIARWKSAKIQAAALFISAIFCLNTLPVCISDMQLLKSIANNHDHFVRTLSKYLIMNPLPNSKHRNLVLAGVNPGSNIEIVVSLNTFLLSLGVPKTSFNVVTTLPSNNPAITSFYQDTLSAINDNREYVANVGDLLLFNPYHAVAIHPTLVSPSYREIFRSDSEWAIPRWDGMKWTSYCVLSPHTCISNISEHKLYTGYAVLLATRLVAPLQLKPLTSPSYRIGNLGLPPRMRRATSQRLDVMVKNTGTETWPANGTSQPGMLVHLAYRWFNKINQVVLEGDRALFSEPMQANDETIVSILLKSPVNPGKYKLVIGPVQEGVAWFPSEIGNEIDVF